MCSSLQKQITEIYITLAASLQNQKRNNKNTKYEYLWDKKLILF